ncbi:hypothetical protein FLW53_39395 [Microbispora sp. SCL1-1]|uniref:hypothetical protein n=1 Tax=unclassified Microbispora TaxID=2614687 RepID=UPI001159FF91|nr:MULTISPECIES: hypothetical protein [unclassified Microbispora]NJP30154.1 hypothetical protein [Microbispora sp. CL1-1]TQS02761.1 hypothetical protein FLW53_39395 [Microbispora sp. SCL1-1]
MTKDRHEELDAWRIAQTVLNTSLTPYDKCPQCCQFHDKHSKHFNSRYDFHVGEIGALEVTVLTSDVAERNREAWGPFIGENDVAGLQNSWIVQVTATARAVIGSKSSRRGKDFISRITPALAALEATSTFYVSRWSGCAGSITHDPRCPVPLLIGMGVQIAEAISSDREEPSIHICTVLGFEEMRSTPKKSTSSEHEVSPSMSLPVHGGSDLVTLVEAELAMKPDLAEKLGMAAKNRTRREVFFWLTWTRASAWRRLERTGGLPEYEPCVPDGITGLWVGFRGLCTEVLYWSRTGGWRRYHLSAEMASLPPCSASIE